MGASEAVVRQCSFSCTTQGSYLRVKRAGFCPDLSVHQRSCTKAAANAKPSCALLWVAAAEGRLLGRAAARCVRGGGPVPGSGTASAQQQGFLRCDKGDNRPSRLQRHAFCRRYPLWGYPSLVQHAKPPTRMQCDTCSSRGPISRPSVSRASLRRASNVLPAAKRTGRCCCSVVHGCQREPRQTAV